MHNNLLINDAKIAFIKTPQKKKKKIVFKNTFEISLRSRQ